MLWPSGQNNRLNVCRFPFYHSCRGKRFRWGFRNVPSGQNSPFFFHLKALYISKKSMSTRLFVQTTRPELFVQQASEDSRKLFLPVSRLMWYDYIIKIPSVVFFAIVCVFLAPTSRRNSDHRFFPCRLISFPGTDPAGETRKNSSNRKTEKTVKGAAYGKYP